MVQILAPSDNDLLHVSIKRQFLSCRFIIRRRYEDTCTGDLLGFRSRAGSPIRRRILLIPQQTAASWRRYRLFTNCKVNLNLRFYSQNGRGYAVLLQPFFRNRIFFYPVSQQVPYKRMRRVRLDRVTLAMRQWHFKSGVPQGWSKRTKLNRSFHRQLLNEYVCQVLPTWTQPAGSFDNVVSSIANRSCNTKAHSVILHVWAITCRIYVCWYLNYFYQSSTTLPRWKLNHIGEHSKSVRLSMIKQRWMNFHEMFVG